MFYLDCNNFSCYNELFYLGGFSPILFIYFGIVVLLVFPKLPYCVLFIYFIDVYLVLHHIS